MAAKAETTVMVPKMVYYRMRIYNDFQLLKRNRADPKFIWKFKSRLFTVSKRLNLPMHVIMDIFGLCDRLVKNPDDKEAYRRLIKAVEYLLNEVMQ